MQNKKILKKINLNALTQRRPEWRLAWLSTFVIGLLIHAYKLLNYLPNHDALLNDYSNQDVLVSGRWFLSLACCLSSYFDLPWVIGLLSLALIALTAVVIVELLQIKKPALIVLTGGLLVSFPGITETFFFTYTADGYVLAMLLSALAVLVSTFERRSIWYSVLSAVFLCLSCGIYQAYVSFALLLMLCYFINELLLGRRSNRECLRFVCKQMCIFASALIAYYFIWKLRMLICGVTATDYAGISEIGSASGLGRFRSPIHYLLFEGKSTLRSLLRYFTDGNLFYYTNRDMPGGKVTLHVVLSVLLFLICLIGFLAACKKSGLLKRRLQFVLAIGAIVLAAPGACMWGFVSFDLDYRPMMLVSLTTIYIYTMLMCERWCGLQLRRVAALLMAVTIFNNGLMANISYFFLNKCYESSYAIGLEMTIRIHELESEYEVEQIAVTGITGDLLTETTLGSSGSSAQIRMLSQYLRTNLFYDQEHIAAFLSKTFHETTPFASAKECRALEERAEVKAMDAWPTANSMKVIDGTLVIKMSDTKE